MNIKGKSTLEKFKNILKLKNYADNTISIYQHYVSEFILSLDKSALHITISDIKNYLENYSYSSISKQNQIYSAVKSFSKYILKINLLGKIFLERPRSEQKLPQVIDKDYLLNQIDNIQNKKHKAIISLAYSVGLRVSEVINLKINDIDSKRMIININQAKGRKDRILPLSPKILIILREYYKEYKPKEYLFNGQKKIKYSSTSCNRIVKKYLGEEYHFHLLRHSCFTSLLESGTDLRIIQKVAGHKNSKTTEIYTHVSTNLLSKIQLPI